MKQIIEKLNLIQEKLYSIASRLNETQDLIVFNIDRINNNFEFDGDIKELKSKVIFVISECVNIQKEALNQKKKLSQFFHF
jgi:hypothetical protein